MAPAVSSAQGGEEAIRPIIKAMNNCTSYAVDNNITISLVLLLILMNSVIINNNEQ